MTRDRKAKQAARIRAQAEGVGYTQARREDRTGGGGGGGGGDEPSRYDPGGGEPSFAQRLLTGLPWADLALDGRRAFEFSHMALPEDLPPAGDRTAGSGLLRVPYPYGPGAGDGGGQVEVSAHVLTSAWMDDYRIRGSHGKGGLAIRVAYPDGFTLAGLTWHYGDYDYAPEQVWQRYLSRPLDGFGRALAGPDEGRDDVDVPVTPADHERTVHRAARMLRSAVEDLPGWFGPDSPPPGDAGGNAAGDLFWLASVGFSRYADAVPFLDRWRQDWPDWLFAQDAGFDLTDAGDRAWMLQAGEDEWPCYLPDYWHGVARLRREGWTLPALTAVFGQIREAERAAYAADREARDRTGQGQEVIPVRWADGPGPAWVGKAGSPAAASARIEAGDAL